MHKILDISLTATAGILILSLALSLWLIPSPDFSEEENRALSGIPRLNIATVLDGSFSEDLSQYLSDRLPLRLSFIRLRTLSEILLTKGECNGVIYCKDGYLLDRGEYRELYTAEKKISRISSLSTALEAQGVPTVTAYVPRGIDVMTSKLPPLYQGNQNKIFELIFQSAEQIDLLTPLKNAAEENSYVWHKTDHHWTTQGAYIAYLTLSDPLGYTPYPADFFTPQRVSDSFLGSIYSRGGCLPTSKDSIDLYRYEGDEDYIITIDQNETYNSFYFLKNLKKKDKYAVFLGGNFASVTIEKKGGDPRPRLLVIKDSFANSLTPFLALHFDIELVDPRFYSSYEELYSKAQGFDAALIIQGLDTVAT